MHLNTDDALLTLVRNSEFFDANWYRARYPDVAITQMDPAEHYLTVGSLLQRDPGPRFSVRQHVAAGVNGGRADRVFLDFLLSEEAKRPQARLAVVFHAYHKELIGDIAALLSEIPERFDLFVTTPHAIDSAELKELSGRYPAAKIVRYENRGRDIAPFLNVLPELMSYELCLKIHTKKGTTKVAETWRTALLEAVLPRRDNIRRIIETFREKELMTIAGPASVYMSAHSTMFENRKLLKEFEKQFAVPLTEDWGFFAGSMFWFRPSAFAKLLDVSSRFQFAPESGLQDGALEHAVERFIGRVASLDRAEIGLIEPRGEEVCIDLFRGPNQLVRKKPTDLFRGPELPAHPVPEKANGDLNIPSHTPLIRGWLAQRGDPTPRTAVIAIDGSKVLEVTANTFRNDLKDHRVNDGYHAFEVCAPVSCVDGRPHKITLIDKDSGIVVKETSATWAITRKFENFEDFLAHSHTNAYIDMPLREADKRSFAMMENVASYLCSLADKMVDPPRVSVIMPCFNRMDTIEEAVTSVLTQSYANLELILVDDASTDGTLEWCRALRDDRVNVIALTKNSGASSARNKGLEHATGQYVAYLDSDNKWDKRYIAAMVGGFARLPDADALYSGQLVFTGTNPTPSGVRFGSLNRSLLLNRNYIDMNAFCHTRASLHVVGSFDTDLKRFVDWDLVLRFARSCKMYSVPVLLSHYFLGKASNTITADPTHFGQLGTVRDKNSVHVEGYAESAILRRDHIAPPLARKVAVIIPSYESLDDLKECISSVLNTTPRELVQIVVVDNASSAPVTKFIRQQTRQGLIRSICNKKNYGFTYAVNQGIDLADSDADIVLLNNDAILLPDALTTLQHAAYTLADCGMVVPQQILPGGTKTIRDHVPYANPSFACDVNLSSHHGNLVNPKLFHDGDYTEISFAPFFCVYIPRHVRNLAGPLDAQFGRHYRSDRIYCDVVRHICGLKIYHVSDSLVLHKLQKSTDQLRNVGEKSAEYDLIFKRNQWSAEDQAELGFVTAGWDC